MTQPPLAPRAAILSLAGAAGGGLLVVLSLGTFAGLTVTTAPLLVGMVLIGLGAAAAVIGLSSAGAGRIWVVTEAVAATLAVAVGITALALPDLIKLVWPPALILLYAQGRRLEAAGDGPLWRSPLILPLFLFSSVAEGTGLLLLTAPLLLPGPAPEWVAGLLIVLVSLRLLVWMAYRRRMEAAAPPAAVLTLGAFSTPFALGGNMAPLILTMLAGVVPDLAVAALAAAGLAVVAGGWALKLVILAAPDRTQ